MQAQSGAARIAVVGRLIASTHRCATGMPLRWPGSVRLSSIVHTKPEEL